MAVATLTHESLGTVRLGRKRPTAIQNVGRFRVVTLDDGRKVFMPRLKLNYNPNKDRSPPPASVDYSEKAIASLARMYLNDQLGDCVIAGKAHKIGVASGNESGECVMATDQEIQRNYESICGPGDNGCNIADVLDAMKAGRYIMAGQPAKIDGYVAVAPSRQLIMVAIDLFGGLTLGVNLTSDCTNSGHGVVWNFRGRIVGGHDIEAYGYDEKGVYISTWGSIGTLIPWSVMEVDAGNNPGVEERYVALVPNWYQKGDLAPNGIDVKSLKADLALIESGNVPDVPPVTPPGPPNPPPPPSPPQSWLQKLIAWLESLLHIHTHVGQPKLGKVFGTGEEFGLTADATLETINWQSVIAWLKAELALYGPEIIPALQAWINALPVGPIVKTALMFLLSMLAHQLPTPAPTPPAA